MGELAKKMGGHGGMDFLMLFRIIECLRTGQPLDQNVYEGCFWSAVGPLSEKSVQRERHAAGLPGLHPRQLENHQTARHHRLSVRPLGGVMVGRILSHYQIVERLGAGGMGEVYKARDTHLDRFVAIKVLHADKVPDPQRKARFVQEAKAASALNHPNIVHIYDIGTDAGIDFIAMEYVSGKALDQLIPRKGMRLNEALRIAGQVADAMARAHEAGIVHRDLKPSNVMVDDRGLVKVVDFGLAKLTETAETVGEATTRAAPVKTDEGAIVGTVAYMSPEQAEGKALDGRSDIFSFGAVVYEMVTGRRAFSGDTAVSTLASVIKEHPKPLSEVTPETPRDLEKLINRCLQKQPDRRWQAMADLRVALGELREESESGDRQAAAPPVQQRLWWRWMALAVVPLIIAGAWGLWRAGTRPAPRTPVLTSRDVIVLADFANSTGDPVFDGTLREWVSNQLENSNTLRAMSPGQMRAILAEMRHLPGAPITGAVTNEVCARAGEKATLSGSIAALGSSYTLTLKATNCQTGETLASQSAEATAKEQVLGSLTKAVNGIREELGESLPSIQRGRGQGVNLVGATTASLEAYRRLRWACSRTAREGTPPRFHISSGRSSSTRTLPSPMRRRLLRLAAREAVPASSSARPLSTG